LPELLGRLLLLVSEPELLGRLLLLVSEPEQHAGAGMQYVPVAGRAIGVEEGATPTCRRGKHITRKLQQHQVDLAK
jgi:hypothetical protein